MKAFYGFCFILNAGFAGANLYFGAQGHLFNLLVGVLNVLVAAWTLFLFTEELA